MKAAQINNYGDASNITINEVDKPTIRPDQALVKISAVSINPFDNMVLSGGVDAMAPMQFPGTLGQDFVGTIEELGSEVTGFNTGDRVYGTTNALFGGSGSLAEYAAVSATNFNLAPASLSDTEVAGLPTATVNALQALDWLNLQPGQKLIINGGAGGVGSSAVQIAKSRGLYVTATASTANVEFVKELGADEVIDYKTTDFSKELSDYDGLLETARREDINNGLDTLADGARAVSIVGPYDESLTSARGIVTESQQGRVSPEVLHNLAALIDETHIKPHVGLELNGLDKTAEAFKALNESSIQGKIVIII